MVITVRMPDIEAQITYLHTARGGRSTPAVSGYRPTHDFGLKGTLNDAVHEYIDCQAVAPGETAMANMWFLSPEYQERRLFSSFKFTVQEGTRIIGHGVVTKVINETLRVSQ